MVFVTLVTLDAVREVSALTMTAVVTLQTHTASLAAVAPITTSTTHITNDKRSSSPHTVRCGTARHRNAPHNASGVNEP